MATIQWNQRVKLIITDVDETIADLFVPATAEMAAALNTLLEEGKSLFLVSGAGFASIKSRIVDLLRPELRQRVLVSHCSGAEVRGFDEAGNELSKPFHSTYDHALTTEQKDTWREIVHKVIGEFHLEQHPVTSLQQFEKQYGLNPLAIMLDDRGPQITLEFINAHNLTIAQREQLRNHFSHFDSADLRIPVMERMQQLLTDAEIPVTPRIAGTFALDLALQDVSKRTSVAFVLNNPAVLSHIGRKQEELQDPAAIEIWGDKFSVSNGGTDRHMSEALPKEVRSIDFRHENPDEFLKGYNIVLWDGEKQLHEGVLEYLTSRHDQDA